MYSQDLDNGLGVRGQSMTPAWWPPPGYLQSRKETRERYATYGRFGYVGGQMVYGETDDCGVIGSVQHELCVAYGSVTSDHPEAGNHPFTIYKWLHEHPDAYPHDNWRWVAIIDPDGWWTHSLTLAEATKIARQRIAGTVDGYAIYWDDAEVKQTVCGSTGLFNEPVNPIRVAFGCPLGGNADLCKDKICPTGQHCESGNCVKDDGGGGGGGGGGTDNTLLYLGIGAVALAGVAILTGGKKKKSMEFSYPGSWRPVQVAGHYVRGHHRTGYTRRQGR